MILDTVIFAPSAALRWRSGMRWYNNQAPHACMINEFLSQLLCVLFDNPYRASRASAPSISQPLHPHKPAMNPETSWGTPPGLDARLP